MFWELQNITRSLQGCKEFLQIYITEMIHVWAHLQLESEMVHSHRHMALVIHGRRTLGAATFTLYRGGISTVENKRRNFFFYLPLLAETLVLMLRWDRHLYISACLSKRAQDHSLAMGTTGTEQPMSVQSNFLSFQKQVFTWKLCAGRGPCPMVIPKSSPSSREGCLIHATSILETVLTIS